MNLFNIGNNQNKFYWNSLMSRIPFSFNAFKTFKNNKMKYFSSMININNRLLLIKITGPVVD